MFSNELVNILFIFIILSMWGILLYHSFLLIMAYKFFTRGKVDINHSLKQVKEWPFVTILIPAHNEEVVIKKTLDCILLLDYPREKIKIVPINDNSGDKTGDILDHYAEHHRSIKPLHIPKGEGGIGKSHTLNEGLKEVEGDFVCVFDADNNPEPNTLKYLVAELLTNPKLGVACGKVRTQNRNHNLLTHFVNLEFISHQWIIQGGRWYLHKFAMIPGTNFVIRKKILDELGGWDEQALTEDSELTFQIRDLGYLISFNPFAITWEQEPETWQVWFGQRLRWIQGNRYIVQKYLNPKRAKFKQLRSLAYMIAVYQLLLISLILSDIIFVVGLLGWVQVSVSGPLLLTWLMAFILFITSISVTLSFEETAENTWKNVGFTCLMYFTYCQMWIVLAVCSLFQNPFKNPQKPVWVKTPRVKLEG